MGITGIIILILGIIAGLILTAAVTIGRKAGIGPFRSLFNDYADEVAAIERKYPAEKREHEIVFYGASNFRLWKLMESDLKEYKVQNHGFGGSTDKMLVKYAPRILFPYKPDLVFFQTGSNDYVNLPGSDAEKIASCMAFKKEMFSSLHEHLPTATFVVMSGLLLPKRSQFTPMTQKINEELLKLCNERDYMRFVDASNMTFDGKSYKENLFISDGIHLNHEGQLLWCKQFIRPEIESVILEKGMNHLRN